MTGSDRLTAGEIELDAVTFDFFNTLVFHREGRGRGRVLVDYLEAQGYRPARWAHAMLYRLFGPEAFASPAAGPAYGAPGYREHLAVHAFRELKISAPREEVVRHAEPLWDILGPDCFEVFSDAEATLGALRAAGLRVGLISNWQHGLAQFCEDLGLARYFDYVVGSADLGIAKPDARIFAAASTHLGVVPTRILHVGDTRLDDYVGGQSAGFHVLLLQRDRSATGRPARVIHGLEEVLTGLAPRRG